MTKEICQTCEQTIPEICQTCDQYIINDECDCCGLCEHIKGGVEEDCPCGREDLHIEGKGRHPRCFCECHGWI